MTSSSGHRCRVREAVPSLFLGFHKTGPLNSITDVPGVLISTQSVHHPAGHNSKRPSSVINTGVTTILPRKTWFDDGCYAAIFSFNGAGEMTGSHWINETGLLNSPIVITNTFCIGSAYTGVYQYAIREYTDDEGGLAGGFMLPVVAETYDGFLNDISAMSVTPEMVINGIETATSDKVQEGNTGGGTGMTTMGFKAGTGSASRIVDAMIRGESKEFIVAALVQSNFGKRRDLRFGPVPVGRLYVDSSEDEIKDSAAEDAARPKEGSIIVVLATNAPLTPTQLGRLVRRATVGLSRVGGWGGNLSGDIFIAFSTAASIPRDPPPSGGLDEAKSMFVATVEQGVDVVQDKTINGLFEAAAEVVEESILNALCMAETMHGTHGTRMNAIDIEQLRNIVNGYSGGK